MYAMDVNTDETPHRKTMMKWNNLQKIVQKAVEKRIQLFHEELVRKYPAEEKCVAVSIEIQDRKPVVYPSCNCGTCTNFLLELLDNHDHKRFPRYIPWGNTSVAQWVNIPWEIAKIYIDLSPDRTLVESSQTLDILQVVDHCQIFSEEDRSVGQKLKGIACTLEHRGPDDSIGAEEALDMISRMASIEASSFLTQPMSRRECKERRSSADEESPVQRGMLPFEPRNATSGATFQSAHGRYGTRSIHRPTNQTRFTQDDQQTADEEKAVTRGQLRAELDLFRRRFHEDNACTGVDSSMRELQTALKALYRERYGNPSPPVLQEKWKLREKDNPDNVYPPYKFLSPEEIQHGHHKYFIKRQRIIIERSAKELVSNMCRKLTFDWASGTKENIPTELEDLSLILHLTATECKYDEIVDAIIKHLLHGDWERGRDHLKTLVENNQGDILIIIDGCEGIESIHRDIAAIVKGNSLPHVRMLITTSLFAFVHDRSYFDLMLQMKRERSDSGYSTRHPSPMP